MRNGYVRQSYVKAYLHGSKGRTSLNAHRVSQMRRGSQAGMNQILPEWGLDVQLITLCSYQGEASWASPLPQQPLPYFIAC
jgi:hypothetical protein